MSGPICCVLINESTAASPLFPQVTDEWLARCAAACSVQLARDAAPIWGPGVGGCRAGANAADVQPGEMVFAILDALPDAPGAIAYHSVDGADVPVAFLALTTCATLDDVSTAISHELLETSGDEGANRWADDFMGSEYGLELCDAVESNAYPVNLDDGGSQIMVSDFVLPSFFSTGASGPYNFMGIAPNDVVPHMAASNPLFAFMTAAGGYQIKRTSGGGETQVTGTIRPLRLAKQKHYSARVFRRGVRLP